MGNHKIDRYNYPDGTTKARCSCGQSSDVCQSIQEREDWELRHDRNIQQVRSYLAKRDPSLESQADYARTMVELATDEKDRVLWRQLADELDTRLGRNAPPSEQLTLGFTEDFALRKTMRSRP